MRVCTRHARVSVGELRSEFLFHLEAELDEPQRLAGTPLGVRRIMNFKGGSFSGPRLKGRILPDGGDWVRLRADGVAELDIHLTLRTEEDELIRVACAGIFDISREACQRILDGGEHDADSHCFRTTLAFETEAERCRWLNCMVAVGVGAHTASGMTTEVFAIG